MIELTPWFPCTTPPVREGWYDVQRKWADQDLVRAERIRFKDGAWDRDSCESKLAIWVSYDYWRGVTEGSAK